MPTAVCVKLKKIIWNYLGCFPGMKSQSQMAHMVWRQMRHIAKLLFGKIYLVSVFPKSAHGESGPGLIRTGSQGAPVSVASQPSGQGFWIRRIRSSVARIFVPGTSLTTANWWFPSTPSSESRLLRIFQPTAAVQLLYTTG